nr:bifunctional DNA primase/polymerase [Saprospiraceae bacterium]
MANITQTPVIDEIVYQRFINSKISIIGCKGKIPVKSWTPYQSRFPSDKEIKSFREAGATGIAAVCGQISGYLICIDFDTKNHPRGSEIVSDCCTDLIDVVGEYLFQMVRVSTPSGGTHLWFRSEEKNEYKNKKLASRITTIEERQINPKVKELTFIEIRAEGGYAMVHPSPGYTIEHGSFENIPTFKNEVVDQIIDVVKSFNEVFDEPTPISVREKREYDNYSLTPWDAYNNDQSNPHLEVLENAGWKIASQKGDQIFYRRPGSENKWSANWHIQKRLFYVFSSSTVFEQDKAYTPFSVLSTIEHNGNKKEATRFIISKGYGKQWEKHQQDFIDEVSIELDKGKMFEDVIQELQSANEHGPEMISRVKDILTEKNIAKRKLYYSLIRNNKGVCLVNIIRHEFRNFLVSTYPRLGKNWRIIKSADDEFLLIDESKKTVENLQNGYEDIAPLLAHWIDEDIAHFINEDEQWSRLLKEEHEKLPPSFKKSLFTEMDKTAKNEIQFLTDDKHNSYFFFSTTVVKVSKEGVDIIPYGETFAYVKKADILERDFNRVVNGDPSDFGKYCYRLSGLADSCDEMSLLQIYSASDQSNWNKLRPLVLAIGYLVHRFKDPSKAFAIIISEDVDDSNKGGGTGKSLVLKSLKYVRNLIEMDGKNLKTHNQFAFGPISSNTDILLLNDLSAAFDIKMMYNQITDSFEVERKGVDRKVIPFELAPKICMTTNYSMGGSDDSEHQSRRIKNLYISKYYTRERTPETDFGRNLFFDWDQNDWNLFYNFIMDCVQIYFRSARVVPNQSSNSNSVKKKIREELNPYGDEFIHFLDESILRPTWLNNNKNTLFAAEIRPQIKYTDFKNEHNIDGSRELSAKLFKDNLKRYLHSMDIPFREIGAPLVIKLGEDARKPLQEWASEQSWFVPEEVYEGAD